MQELINEICECIKKDGQTVVATILTLSGSAPRTPGTKMVVGRDGQTAGTIGGGTLEARVTAVAQEIFKTGTARLLEFDLSDEAQDDLDMVCGGRVGVLLERLSGPGDLALYEALHSLLSKGQNGLVVSRYHMAEGKMGLQQRGLARDIAEAIRLMEKDARTGKPALGSRPWISLHGDTLWVVEPFQGRERLFVFGAGHVGREVAVLAARVGFAVTVLDDRAEFVHNGRYPQSVTPFELPSFAACFAGLDPGSGDSVVIVTRGHRHDRDVLAQSLQTPMGYIGMIGSKKKRDAVYASLEREGFSKGDLERVHCPVGLDIGAQTPEEIAVSIVAELIQARAAAGKDT